MNFSFSSEQLELIEGVRDFLAGVHGPEILRELDGGGRETEKALQTRMTEMGLFGFLIPEAFGGIGRSLAEAAAVAVEIGRAGVAGSFVDTALVAAPLISKTSASRDLLSSIAAGGLSIGLAHPVNPWVANAASAHRILAASDGAVFLSRVSRADQIDSIDPLRKLHLVEIATGEAISISGDQVLDHAALMTAGEALGCAEAMLSMASEYAKTRQQFGQPIGAFQAVKHLLANVAVEIEFARPVLWRAAVALEAGRDTSSVHVSHALISCRKAAILASETAIQVHGAMGYTYEVDLHYWMKRAWALAGAWGDHSFHQSRVDIAIIQGGLPIGPSETFH